MANSTTLFQRLPIKHKSGAYDEVLMYRVVLDTAASDLTVHTTTTGAKAAVVSWQFSTASAFTLTWKSDANTILAMPFPANSGFATDQMGFGPVITKASEDLIVRATTAGPGELIICVAEFLNAEINN